MSNDGLGKGAAPLDAMTAPIARMMGVNLDVSVGLIERRFPSRAAEAN